MCSGVIGNLMGAFVVANVKQSTFYTVMTAFCIISSLFFLLLKQPIPQPDEVGGIGYSVRESNKTSEIDKKKTRVKEDMIETVNLMFSSRMLKIVPLMMWTAISTAVYVRVFVTLMTDTMPQNLKSVNWSE